MGGPRLRRETRDGASPSRPPPADERTSVSGDERARTGAGWHPTSRRGFLKGGAALAGTLVGASALAACGSSSSGAATSAPPVTVKPKIGPKVDGDISFLTFAEYIPPDV